MSAQQAKGVLFLMSNKFGVAGVAISNNIVEPQNYGVLRSQNYGVL